MRVSIFQADYSYCCVMCTCIVQCIGGFQPPVDDWKKILDDMNTKARKLEEEYEVTCTMKKVYQQILWYSISTEKKIRKTKIKQNKNISSS